ncbi:MAG: cation transporter [Armatimonadetes bacterium]|nr:cation transporter [Armatimonadota bacterium]
MASLKTRAATLSLGFNVVQTTAKFVGAYLTGSVSLLTEAAHSATDIFASALTLIAVKVAAAPPDEEHPYGHGKAESLASFAESLVLFGMVAYISYHAVRHLTEKVELVKVDTGLFILSAVAIVGFTISKLVASIGKKERSPALQAHATHLLSDVLTTLGVLAALLVAKLTGISAADAVFALILAAWLAHRAYRLLTESINQLIDRRMPDHEYLELQTLLNAEPRILGYHRLRTRVSGNTNYIDLHIEVPNSWTVVQAHDVADDLEVLIEERFNPAQCVIHVDPR